MKIDTYQHGRGIVIAPRDAIVEAECADLRRSVSEALARGPSQVVIDMAEVPFVDSAGLELLCELESTCSDGGAYLKLAATGDICNEILRITDLAGHFQVFPSVEEAAKSLTQT